ncbi:hypothetical protein [Spirochaeta dissipatitropha]
MISRIFYILLLAACMLAAPLLTFSDDYDDLDDLFGDDTFGIIEDEPEADEGEPGKSGDAGGASAASGSGGSVDISAMTTRPTTFSGSVSLDGGMLYGLSEWPWLHDPDWNLAGPGDSAGGALDSLGSLSGGSVFYDMSSRFTVDARPRAHLRYRLSVSTKLDRKTLRFSDIGSVDEFFVDYTLADNYFFRIGKHSSTWGQGRHLGNPGNIVSDSGGGVALRAFIPLGPSGLTALIYGRQEFFKDLTQPSPREFAYAAQYDLSFGDFTFGMAGRYLHFKAGEAVHETRASAFAKTSLAGMDLTLEGVSRFKASELFTDSDVAGAAEFLAIANIFYEFGSPKWQLIAEYMYDKGHLAGIGVKMPRFLEWTPGLSWKHAFQDNSGEFVLGAERTVAPNLKASIGLPVTYGTADSYYRSRSDVPGKRVAALVGQLGISFSF